MELAVLLLEAHRSDAHRAWGAASLGHWALACGVSPKLFEKYKRAADALLATYPDDYDDALQAILAGAPAPELPSVTRLANLPRIRKMAVGRGASFDDALKLALWPRVPVATALALAEAGAYEGTSPEGKSLLRALDDLTRLVADSVSRVASVRDAPPDVIPTEQRATRFSALRGYLERLLAAVDSPTRG
jgi:hypothetical protein